ncbi:MAG: hypothetical protein WA156_13575 [Methylocystis silviterrae]
MRHAWSQEDALVQRLQRALPLGARGRPALLAFLRARGVIGNIAPRLKVIGIFPAGAQGEFLCRFSVEDGVGAETFVAPLGQLALDRRHLAARKLDLCRR